MSDAKPRARVYTQEEVNAILSRAVERQNPTEGLTHEELLDTARQAGISLSAVEAAAEDVSTGRVVADEDRKVAAELSSRRQRAWRGFFSHFVTYAMVNVLLVFINLQTGHHPWAVYPLLGWGIGIALHFFAVAFPNPGREERVRRELRRREEKRRARERGGAPSELGQSAKELGRAVERGVATMLATAAKKIDEEVGRAESKPPAVRVEGNVRVGERAREREREDDVDDEETEEAREKRRARGR